MKTFKVALTIDGSDDWTPLHCRRELELILMFMSPAQVTSLVVSYQHPYQSPEKPAPQPAGVSYGPAGKPTQHRFIGSESLFCEACGMSLSNVCSNAEYHYCNAPAPAESWDDIRKGLL